MMKYYYLSPLQKIDIGITTFMFCLFIGFLRPLLLNLEINTRTLDKINKLRNESIKKIEDVEKEVNELLNNNLYKDRKIWMEEKYDFLKIKDENIKLILISRI